MTNVSTKEVFKGCCSKQFINLHHAKIGFGGSCYWCTEAIFRSLDGVLAVDQSWVSSEGENAAPSEAVFVQVDPSAISLKTLIAIHHHTHSCTSSHEMHSKYRSATYTFKEAQSRTAMHALQDLQEEYDEQIVTKVLSFQTFKLNEENYLDYYYIDPTKLFCQNIVSPKLKMLMEKFGMHIAPELKRNLSAL